MLEHHNEEEIFFGEEYYDEDLDDSDANEIVDDPYAEAERLGRLQAKHHRNRQAEYMTRGKGSPFKAKDPFQTKPNNI